jgi:acetylornithine/succinyldiaminopimelate/putrescine aminotransferase
VRADCPVWSRTTKQALFISREKRRGEYLLQTLAAMISRYEFLREVRGRGLMIGIEFGPPRSLKLKASWHGVGNFERRPVLPTHHNAAA